MEHDEVNEPQYYNNHPSGVRCIDIAEHHDFCIGNVIKYVWRAGLKTKENELPSDAEIRDLKKAEYYIKRKIAQLESKKTNGN